MIPRKQITSVVCLLIFITALNNGWRTREKVRALTSGSDNTIDGNDVPIVTNSTHTIKTVKVMRSRTENDSSIPIIAYQITATQCKPDFYEQAIDQLAVLRHSIELSSYPQNPSSKYGAKFYALIHLTKNPHSQMHKCVKMFESLNFTIRSEFLPVQPADIQSEYIKQKIQKDGCCGHLELLKLHIYTYDPTIHPIALNLDLDMILLQPLDTLFDSIIHHPDTEMGSITRRKMLNEGYIAPTYHSDESIHEKVIDGFYTKDYNMVRIGTHHRVGIQGGLLIVRPNQTRFDALIKIVKTAEFVQGNKAKDTGWNKSGYGRQIFGSMSIQGLMAYYYHEHHLRHVELNRCIFNQIADNPRRTSYSNLFSRPSPLLSNATWHDTSCRDGRPECDDVQCQTWPIENSKLLHYTYCNKATQCQTHPLPEDRLYLNEETCEKMHREWFRVRQSLERKIHGDDMWMYNESSIFEKDVNFGACAEEGNYRPMSGKTEIRFMNDLM